MASFTDQPSVALTQYDPSVDLGLMSSALRYKQNQYDMNVQKIQSTIDNVAGLDVYRPIDKQYLTEKVNGLTSNLNKIGGSDFSNNSIVSQAIGMAGPIYKDPNVQAAVSSTQNIKKLMADQKQLQDKHPELYSAENEWYDNLGINKYISSNKLGEMYGGATSATRYFDWQKPIKEAVEKLGPGVNYKINSDGRFQYFIEKNSTVKPSDIENVVNGLIDRDPRIQKQMFIAGQYTYKDYDAPSLKNHINSFYDHQIPHLEELLAYYKEKKDTDPTNPFFNDRLNDFIKDTENTINQMRQSQQDYNTHFDNGVDLSKIKQTFFNDEVRKTYVINYQKNDKELEIKTNQSAVQAQDNWFKNEHLKLARAGYDVDVQKLRMSMIAQGMDPDNGMPISMDNSKYLQGFYNANVKNMDLNGNVTLGNGKMGNGSTFGQSGMQSSTPGEEVSKYTQGANNERISAIDKVLIGIDNDLMKDYAPLTKFHYGTPEFKIAFDEWKKTQEQHLKNHDGQAIDIYIDYKNKIQDEKLYQQSLKDLDNEITQKAIRNNPFKSLNEVVRIDGLNIQNPDGSKQTSLSFKPGEHENFVMKFNKFHQEVINNVKAKYGEGYLDDVTDRQNDPNIKKVAQQLAETYKSDPDYRLFKAFADGGWNKIREGAHKIIAPVDKLMSTRQQEIDKDFEDKGSKLTYRTTIFQGKEEQMTAAKKLVQASLSNQNVGGKIPTDVKDINPIEGYMDDEHKAHIRYTDLTEGSTAKVKDVIVANDRMIFGNPEPFYKIQKAIEINPKGMTPTTGDNVLISDNGKIRFAIQQRSDKTYGLYILDESGTPVPISPGFDAQGKPRSSFRNISDIMNQVNNNLSILQDPATKKPLTPQQLIEIAKKNYQKY